MSKYLFFILISMLFCVKNNYWNLGLAITDKSKRIIKKDIRINEIIAEESYILDKNTTIYTLDKSYIVEPKKYENAIYVADETVIANHFHNIKSLIANSQYFEAAKKIAEIDEEKIEIIFNDYNDFYYNSSMTYYNLGNMEEAKRYLENISDRENSPELIFLEALILRESNPKKSKTLLENIIKYFPTNDYADYAVAMLKDNQ
tara:strand:- start:3328 stop:3936 length:609 start_codon:yes stop_codon:yes gene_type:complete